MIGSKRVLRNVLFLGVLTASTPFLPAQEIRSSNLQIENGVERVGPIQHPGATKPSFTLTLSPGTRNKNISEFRAGSSVRVTVKMTNITNHTIDCSGYYSDAGDMSYSYDVRDEEGKPVERIVRPHPELDMPSPFWSSISPGESDARELRMEKVVKLDKTGTYTVQVFRHDPDFLDKSGKPTIIKSNIITFTVVAADSAPNATK